MDCKLFNCQLVSVATERTLSGNVKKKHLYNILQIPGKFLCYVVQKAGI
jgi:hypothetical protein